MKINKKYIFQFFIILLLTSCVPYKDTLYLDKNKDKISDVEVNADAFKPYRVQIGDVLMIKVKTTDEKISNMFSKEDKSINSAGVIITEQSLYFDGYQIDDFGNVRLPLIGDFSVINLTVDEITKKLERKLLDEYLKSDLGFFVTVKIAGIKYFTNGEIGKTGSNIVYQDKLTVLEAIATSGDIKDTGNRKEVVIMRKTPTGFQTETINLTDANVINSPYFYIKPNDYIYVKPLKQKSTGIGTNGLQTLTTVLSLFGVLTTTYLLIKSL